MLLPNVVMAAAGMEHVRQHLVKKQRPAAIIKSVNRGKMIAIVVHARASVTKLRKSVPRTSVEHSQHAVTAFVKREKAYRSARAVLRILRRSGANAEWYVPKIVCHLLLAPLHPLRNARSLPVAARCRLMLQKMHRDAL